MRSQRFTHENELLAFAPLDSDEDHQLFKAQQVNLVGEGNVQWDFILHNGADFHFRQPFFHLMHFGALKACKNEIRARLKHLAEESELMKVAIDGKEVSANFHYERDAAGRLVKYPELEGEFVEATCLGDSTPIFITKHR